MLAGASLMAVTLAGTATRASAQAPPAKAAVTEPVRKVVLDNARVHVKDVTFAPGPSPMHTHALAHVGIILTAGTLVFTEPGKPAESVKFDAGSVGFREAGVTHQVTNPGSTPMRVIEVELK
jgi:quercetin dioxygenase-like cupin family protein